MLSNFVANRWETSATKAVDADWFASDLGALTTDDANSQKGGIDRPVKHTLQIMAPTLTIVNIQLKKDSITKVLNVNGGTALTAGSGYQFELVIYPGQTYNIQHKTGTQNVSCTIAESYNVAF